MDLGYSESELNGWCSVHALALLERYVMRSDKKLRIGLDHIYEGGWAGVAYVKDGTEAIEACKFKRSK